MHGGTALEIDRAISDPANTQLHDALAAHNVHEIISIISRQTGRALFQECITQIVSLHPANIIGELKGQLLVKLQDLIPHP